MVVLAEESIGIGGAKLAEDPQAKPFYMERNDVVTVAESFF